MKKLFRILLLLATFATTGMAAAADLSGITSKEAVTALRTTLTKGAEAAIGNLGKTDGFLGNPAARINCPNFWRKAKAC